jgi:prepilin-type N-terminal cleavage/methylation domain-containing protein
MSYVMPKQRAFGCKRGFTLIETALAVVIVGLAVGGMLQLLAAGTQSNISANEMTTALNLTKNIKEFASRLAYQDPANPGSAFTPETTLAKANDIWDLNGLSLSPPVDCRGVAIAEYPNWTQKITVQTVSSRQLVSTAPNDPTQPTAMITVTILHQKQTISINSWLVCAPNPNP